MILFDTCVSKIVLLKHQDSLTHCAKEELTTYPVKAFDVTKLQNVICG